MTMMLGSLQRDPEKQAEVVQVLAGLPHWDRATLMQIGTYLLERLEEAAFVHPAPPAALDAAGDLALEEAPPPDWGAASPMEQLPPEPAFRRKTVRENLAGRTTTITWVQASRALERLMTPVALTPNEIKSRLSVHPTEFPMLTPPLAWRKLDSWLKTAPVLSDDAAPSASLDHLEARAAPTQPRAQPGPLGSLPWPQKLASGRPKVEDFPLSTTRTRNDSWRAGQYFSVHR